MKKKESAVKKKKEKLPGYPEYPAGDDIFQQAEEEPLGNPDELSRKQVRKPKDKTAKEINPGGDLDVPGSELDDADEIDGNEDEENNYYSLGGDDHSDLDEE